MVSHHGTGCLQIPDDARCRALPLGERQRLFNEYLSKLPAAEDAAAPAATAAQEGAYEVRELMYECSKLQSYSDNFYMIKFG